MSAATSTILTVAALGIGAGTQLYAAKKQGDAAKKAGEQQQAGVKEARAYAEPLYNQARDQMGQVYQQSQAGLAPFAAQGTQGLYALSDFLGVPRAPAGANTMTAPAPTSTAPPVATPTFTPRPMPPGATVVGSAVPRGTVPAATQSSYVTLRAPTGEQQQVPAEHANYYLSRGATRV
jgi:hypothetical protein